MMQLDRIVRAAGASLAESLNYYWPPTNADVMALERNISLHMAHAFRAAGQLVYGEVNAATDQANRYDFLAIDPVQKRFTIAEFKRLDTRQSATRLVRDWRRLQRFRLQRSATHQHPLLAANPPVRWVLLAGITSSLELARWFNTTDANQSDPWTKPGSKGPLDTIWDKDWKKRLNAGDLYIDAVPLADWHEPEDTRCTHWLVYVFARA